MRYEDYDHVMERQALTGYVTELERKAAAFDALEKRIKKIWGPLVILESCEVADFELIYRPGDKETLLEAVERDLMGKEE